MLMLLVATGMAGGARNWGTKMGHIAEMDYKWISDHCLELSFETLHGTPQFPLMMLLLPSMALNLWHSDNEPKYGLLRRICTERKEPSLQKYSDPILMRCLASKERGTARGTGGTGMGTGERGSGLKLH